MRFYCTCVDWPKNDIDSDSGLCDMVDRSIDITRATFLKHVDKMDLSLLESGLGYNSDFKMSHDYAVSYHRSKLHGKRVYYFRHSAIEYVFTKR